MRADPWTKQEWYRLDGPRSTSYPATANLVDKLGFLVDRLVTGLNAYMATFGGIHEDGCPEDDTCACEEMGRILSAYREAIAWTARPETGGRADG